MRGIRRLPPIRQVARLAGRRKPQVISDRGVCVALLTLYDGVRAEQRKPIEVLLDRLDRNLPAKNCVALGAVGTELRAVNVSVAIGAVLANASENRLGVASRAGYFFVHAAKRVSRGVMVELRNGADGGPAGGRVAIFARNVQWTVRTSAWLSLSGGRCD